MVSSVLSFRTKGVAFAKGIDEHLMAARLIRRVPRVWGLSLNHRDREFVKGIGLRCLSPLFRSKPFVLQKSLDTVNQ